MTIRETLLALAARVKELDPALLGPKLLAQNRAEIVASLRCLAARTCNESEPLELTKEPA